MEPIERRDQELLGILRIGHDTSLRGVGLSLRDALSKARYAEIRPHFEESDLLPYLRDQPALLHEWRLYSEDKRTGGGWYLLENGTIGQLRPQSEIRYPSLEEAVAAYVVRELDFWANLNKR